MSFSQLGIDAVAFEAERRLIRLHPRGRRLLLPTLALTLAAFLFALLQTFMVESWQQYLLWGLTGGIAFFFWLVPLIGYLTTWVDITTARIVARSGLFGQHFREISHSRVARIELGLAGRIIVYVEGEEALELASIAKPRLVASELARLAGK